MAAIVASPTMQPSSLIQITAPRVKYSTKAEMKKRTKVHKVPHVPISISVRRWRL